MCIQKSVIINSEILGRNRYQLTQLKLSIMQLILFYVSSYFWYLFSNNLMLSESLFQLLHIVT